MILESVFAHLPWMSYAERFLKWLPPLYSRIPLQNRITGSFTPKDVFASAERAPIEELPYIYERYLGHRVHWRVVLKDVENHPKNKRMLNLVFTFFVTQADTYCIRCTVRSNRYPKVSDLRNKGDILLFGRIEAIAQGTITLSKPVLTIIPWS